jgi:hypothetical protein
VENCGKSEQPAAAFPAFLKASCDIGRDVDAGAGPAALRACSACAGDYEDPERTAWPADEEAEDARENAEDANVEEIPAAEK